MNKDIVAEDMEAIRIDFMCAHALLASLTGCVYDEAQYKKDADDLFVVARRLGDFVASALGVSAPEAANRTIGMIQDESKAKAFLDEHIHAYAS